MRKREKSRGGNAAWRVPACLGLSLSLMLQAMPALPLQAQTALEAFNLLLSETEEATEKNSKSAADCLDSILAGDYDAVPEAPALMEAYAGDLELLCTIRSCDIAAYASGDHLKAARCRTPTIWRWRMCFGPGFRCIRIQRSSTRVSRES